MRCASARSICVFVSECSTRAVTFSVSFGLRIESAKNPDGVAATIVFVSNESTPSIDSDSDVCCFHSGPFSAKPYRSCRSSPLTGANTFRAFSAASRKPMFVDPRHVSMPGLVVTSIDMNPASCTSAANMLRRNRID